MPSSAAFAVTVASDDQLTISNPQRCQSWRVGARRIGGSREEPGRPPISASIDAKFDTYRNVAHQIWNFAKVGYQERESSALLRSELTKAAFRV